MTTQLIIAVCGDSITGCSGRWPFQALGVTSAGDCGEPLLQSPCTYYNGRMMMRNMAISGSRLAGGSGVGTIRPAYVDTIYAVKALSPSGTGTPARLRKYLYINAIGSNDGAIGGLGSVAAYAAAVAADIVAGKTAGADYGWICSLLPRADAAGPMDETNRLAYNALVTDSAWRLANGVDDCIDLASATHAAPAFLPVNSGGDTTWFDADNIHPTAALSAECGVIALAKFNALLAVI